MAVPVREFRKAAQYKAADPVAQTKSARRWAVSAWLARASAHGFATVGDTGYEFLQPTSFC
jgi:hypothetical protein